jgi:hypothetical protein
MTSRVDSRPTYLFALESKMFVIDTRLGISERRERERAREGRVRERRERGK